MDRVFETNGIDAKRDIAHLMDKVRSLDLGRRIGPIAAVLLVVGLGIAMATDGSLPDVWSRALFGALVVVDLIVTAWLID